MTAPEAVSRCTAHAITRCRTPSPRFTPTFPSLPYHSTSECRALLFVSLPSNAEVRLAIFLLTYPGLFLLTVIGAGQLRYPSFDPLGIV